jgi:arylsulfatase A-like enzyme
MSHHLATQDRPNILLITTDQQRFDAMRLNNPDTPLRTANLDWLASQGVNFTRAYTTCPVCIPARRSLLTGLHPTTHGLTGYQDGLDWDPPFTVPGRLAEHGYQTQLIGKLHLSPQRKRYGFQNMIRSDSPNYRPDSDQHPVNDYTEWLLQQDPGAEPNNHGVNGNSRIGRPFNLDENLHQTSWLADQAIDFLTRRRDPTCPWFLHLSFWAPHPPMIPPQAYWDLYKDIDVEPTFGDWSRGMTGNGLGKAPDAAVGPFDPEEIRRATAGYFGLIHHIDDRIRAVMDRYFMYGNARRNEPTLIIFTSDHGEMLGDHHLWRKSLPYEASAHVPFFVTGYNMDLASGSSDALVGLEDVAATIFDAAGVSQPEQFNNDLDSQSLMPALRGETLHTRDQLHGQIHSGGFSNHFTIEDQHKYIRFNRTGEEQLFNVIDDPTEQHDLSSDTQRLGELREATNSYMQSTGQDVPEADTLKPCLNQCPSVFDK